MATATKNFSRPDSSESDRLRLSRTELARKISSFTGSEERRETDIPGLTLVRRTVVKPPVCMTYQPSIAVIAQGRKRVELGRNTFLFDESRFLLTSVDLPVVAS